MEEGVGDTSASSSLSGLSLGGAGGQGGRGVVPVSCWGVQAGAAALWSLET